MECTTTEEQGVQCFINNDLGRLEMLCSDSSHVVQEWKGHDCRSRPLLYTRRLWRKYTVKGSVQRDIPHIIVCRAGNTRSFPLRRSVLLQLANLKWGLVMP